MVGKVNFGKKYGILSEETIKWRLKYLLDLHDWILLMEFFQSNKRSCGVNFAIQVKYANAMEQEWNDKFLLSLILDYQNKDERGYS